MQGEDVEAPSVQNITQLRLPDFWKGDVESWFERVDAFFTLRRIKSDEQRIAWLTQGLPADIYVQTRDIFRSLPETDSYNHVKAEILKRLGPTKDQKLQQLLAREELGDQKPSTFLRKLQCLADKEGTDDMLRTIWINRLPNEIRKLLATQTACSLTDQAETADHIWNILGKQQHTFAATATRPPLVALDPYDDYRRLIEKNQRDMQQLVSGVLDSIQSLAISLKQDRGRSPRRQDYVQNDRVDDSKKFDRRRNRSRSRPRFNSDGTCFYHGEFGSKARKCLEGCKFFQSGNVNSKC